MTEHSSQPAEFADLGGMASMDPSPPLRWLQSQVMRRMGSAEALARRRVRAERKRQRRGDTHQVSYYHQADDAYSFLAAQVLDRLLATYNIELECHLVAGPSGRNAPEPQLLLDLARRDAAVVAPHYGLEFPQQVQAPSAAAVTLAQQLITAAAADDFGRVAVAVGRALFDASAPELLAEIAAELPVATAADTQRAVATGTAQRNRRGHYSGAMFHYAGEWYWGTDRLYHLEQRLAALGARRGLATDFVVPRPAIEHGTLRDNGSLTFEIYPSLRSPYTSFIFDHALALGAATGVNTVVRPVLPMVMRGVPATRQKGRYIFSDAAREARTLGLTWGKAYDPIGEPVRRAYSLYPWARAAGRGNEFLSAFLHAAFFDGVNTNADKGMQQVVAAAGLDWSQALEVIGNNDWQAEVEANRLAMYNFGSWGVPSFRLLDAAGSTLLALWGQDRLWLFAREIQRLLAQRPQPAQRT